MRILSNSPFFEQLSVAPAFVGARAFRLANLISEQVQAFLKNADLVIPTQCVSLVLFLDKNGPASLVEIARALDEQHQLTAHRAKQLESLSLVRRKQDANDKRRRTFHLTQKGRVEAEKVEAVCRQGVEIFEDLSEELGCDLNRVLNSAHALLQQRPVVSRAIENQKNDVRS
ncbi:hypothetical protein [Parasphingorhabdus sp.]|uniref:hypothetical protein n=1 Tax=Parasphingorhabdus sp. TaxID=2709688 RepID=UPI003267D78D